MQQLYRHWVRVLRTGPLSMSGLQKQHKQQQEQQQQQQQQHQKHQRQHSQPSTAQPPLGPRHLQVDLFTSYRVQHNNARGPFKGGILYHQDVSLEEVARWAGGLCVCVWGGGAASVLIFLPKGV